MSEVSEPELSMEPPEPISMRFYESRHRVIETDLDTVSVSLTASVVSMKKHPECVDSQPVSISTTPLTWTPPLADHVTYTEKPSEQSPLISELQVRQQDTETIPVLEKPPKISEEFQQKELDTTVNPPATEDAGRYRSMADACCDVIVFFSDCCLCYGGGGNKR